jgi:hypothetical protein
MHVESIKSVLKIIICLTTTNVIHVDCLLDETNQINPEQRDISSNHR